MSILSNAVSNLHPTAIDLPDGRDVFGYQGLTLNPCTWADRFSDELDAAESDLDELRQADDRCEFSPGDIVAVYYGSVGEVIRTGDMIDAERPIVVLFPGNLAMAFKPSELRYVDLGQPCVSCGDATEGAALCGVHVHACPDCLNREARRLIA